MSSGGKRPGSGRPRLDKEKRVSITLSVATETKDNLTELRRRGVKVGRHVDELMRRLVETTKDQ